MKHRQYGQPSGKKALRLIVGLSALTLVGCGTMGPGGCDGNATNPSPNDVTFESGQVKASGATIVVNGQVYSDQAAVSDDALVGIVKDDQAYLYHPTLGPAELSDENSRRAVGYFIVGLSAGSSSDKRIRSARLAIGESTRLGTGVDVTRTEQTTYRFSNAKNRWVAIKINNPAEPSHVLLPPRSTLVDAISLGGLLSFIPGVSIGPSESRDVAVGTSPVETYGSITRVFPLLFIPGPWGDGIRSKAQVAMGKDMELFRTVCFVEFVHMVVEGIQALAPDPSDCIEGLALNGALDLFNTSFIGFVGGDQVVAQEFAEALLADLGQSAVFCACTVSAAAGNPAAPVCVTAGLLLDILAFFNWIIDDNFLGTYDVITSDAYASIAGIAEVPGIEPPGACCFNGVTCNTNFTQSNCTNQGGVWQGAGTTSCSNCPPLPPTGACCFNGVTCNTNFTQSNCTNQGGVWQGAGTTSCTNCPPTGACCVGGDNCITNVTQVSCNSQGGVWQGAGSTSCSNCDPTGACCFSNFTCQILTQSQCNSQGGTYKGNNTRCSSCPSPTSDLIVDRIVFVGGGQTITVRHGQTATLDATVNYAWTVYTKNIGDDSAGSSVTLVGWKNGPNNCTVLPLDYFMGGLAVDPLSPDVEDSNGGTWLWGPDFAGTYSLVARADRDGNVDEGSAGEANNDFCATVNVTGPTLSPDLIVDRIVFVGGGQTITVRHGQTATLDATVNYAWTVYTKNIGGDSASSSVTLVAWKNGPNNCTVLPFDYFMGGLAVDPLSPDVEDSNGGTWLWGPDFAGTYSLVARADRDGNVDEGSAGEANNDFCATVIVTGPTLSADLIVDRIVFVGGGQTITVRHGQTATLDATVNYAWTVYTKNIGGDSASSSVTLVAWKNGPNNCTVLPFDYFMGGLAVDPLSPDAEDSNGGTWLWGPDFAGIYSLVARADRDGAVNEGTSGEANNDFCATVNVTP